MRKVQIGKIVENLLLFVRPNIPNARGEGTSNRLTCFMVRAKNDKTSSKMYSYTYSDDQAEIITDIMVKRPGKPGTQKFEVKFNPWVDINVKYKSFT